MQRELIFHSPRKHAVPAFVQEFARAHDLRVSRIPDAAEVISSLNRTFPSCVVVDDSGESSLELARSLKSDTFCAIVPVIFVLDHDKQPEVVAALEAGAEDVLTAGMPESEIALRLKKAVERAERDVSVHPTTRLPGTVFITRDLKERVATGEKFAVCYADLDHFKEYNDRYGYDQGDRIILMVSRIIRDIVKALAPMGFIGHIGGDDFIFTVPLGLMPVTCETILEVADELLPLQYSLNDRTRGYIVARDRRGSVHRIPLMTLSIGVVTNQIRTFSHTAEINSLATEMKSYAKTLPGSVYAVDRRTGSARPAYAGYVEEESVDDLEEAAEL